MARTYQNHDFGYATPCLAGPSDHQALVTIAEDVQPQAQQGFPYAPEPYAHSPEQTSLAYEQHGTTTVATCQMSAQGAAYSIEPMRILPMLPRVSHERLIYINPYECLPTQLSYQQPQQHQQQQHQQRRGSARITPLARCAYDYPEMHYMHAPDSNNGVHVPVEMAPHSYRGSMRPQAYTYNSDLASPHSSSARLRLPTQGHRHHRLSNHHPSSKLCRNGYSDGVYNAEEQNPLSVVGQPGMPQPAAKPKDPKHKFTLADDTLLLELKETKGLMWKQIKSFFPGRSSGTLQVRYCTKLKAKSTVWTEDTVNLHPLPENEQNLLTFSRRSNASARPSKHTSMIAGVLYLGLWAKAFPPPPAKKKPTSCAANIARA
jgi:hypothetical protein